MQMNYKDKFKRKKIKNWKIRKKSMKRRLKEKERFNLKFRKKKNYNK